MITPRAQSVTLDQDETKNHIPANTSQMARIKSNGKFQGAVTSNPFFMADRQGKSQVSSPQTTTNYASAHRLPKASDCVPRRRMSRSINGSLPDKSDLQNENQTIPDPVLTRDANRLDEVATSLSLADNHHGEQSRTGNVESGPLTRQIDQLYHHAQDLHHSQHIMEHLAAGSVYLDAQNTSRIATASAKGGDAAILRNHSEHASQYGSEVSSIDALIHEAKASNQRRDTVIPPPLFQNAHDLDLDNVVEVAGQPSLHPISDDTVVPQPPSPKTHGIAQDMFSKVPGWQKFHQKSTEVENNQPTLRSRNSEGPDAREGMARLPPEDTSPSSYRPMPKINPGKLLPESEETGVKLQQPPHTEGVVSSRYKVTTQDRIFPVRGDINDGIPSSACQHKEAKSSEKYGKIESLQVADMDKSSRLHYHTSRRNVNTSPGNRREKEVSKNLGRSDAPAPALSTWRQELKKIESQYDYPPARKTIPCKASEWRRSLSKLPDIPQPILRRRSTCTFCHPSESSKSSVSLEHGMKHHHSHDAVTCHENSAATPSRLSVRQIEQSLCQDSLNTKKLHDSTDRGQTRLASDKAKEKTPSNIVTGSQVLGEEYGVTMKQLDSTAVLPTDHACGWRSQYMSLSSEVEHLRSELRVRQAGWAKGAAQQPDRIDVGVREALAQHKCDGVDIKGLTIVMHMRGRDDLVINTDLTREGSVCESE
jgi:hypothetical protein